MCVAGCSRPQAPERTVGPGPRDCAAGCPAARRFVITFGDPGLGTHNAGRLFQLAANTHKREILAGAFPGNIPRFQIGTDILTVVHIGTVGDMVSAISPGNVVYLAYFGHSWGFDTGAGVLYIGETSGPGTNLTNRGGPNDRPATDLPADKLRSDAQTRLFGCRGGYGSDPAAKQMADQLRVPVYAYTNSGGSLFTTDAALGHGGRPVGQRDIDTRPPANATDIWLIPINGTPTFRSFTP